MPSSEAYGKALLGDSGSAPGSGAQTPADADASVQTGERTVIIDVDSGRPSKLTVYEGGNAKDGSNVVVREGTTEPSKTAEEAESAIEGS